MRKKVLFVFGTRPEAIKLAPVIRLARQRRDHFNVRVCLTGQHREALEGILDLFDIHPDVRLNVLRKGQSIAKLAARAVDQLDGLIAGEEWDWVVVQGDTASAVAGGLAAALHGRRLAHVEAGLRTYDDSQPFPEEINRRLLGSLATLHLAPTHVAAENLKNEGVPPNRVFVTGNPVIDALLWVRQAMEHGRVHGVEEMRQWASRAIGSRKMVLVTAHRRENFNGKADQLAWALSDLASRRRDIEWVVIVHPRPEVQKVLKGSLDRSPNVRLLGPVPYAPFVWLMSRAFLLLTDSGGLQEEAPSLGRRVLLMRNITERPEGLEGGFVELIGNDRDSIVSGALAALEQDQQRLPGLENPFGDGRAAHRIIDLLASWRGDGTGRDDLQAPETPVKTEPS
jgi:UDP-N-acetylglucosamine 2-epimerase